jgi:LacI family transcriptional regulator
VTKPKMKDIALKLDLSIPTVSRALGGFDDIAEDTRKLVLNTAREMGYRPNIAARNLVAQKSPKETILILGVPNVLKSISLNSYYAEIIRAFCNTVDSKRYQLVLSTEHDDQNEFIDYHKLVSDHSATAAIILDLKKDDERVPVLRKANIPFIVLGEFEPESEREYAVWTDNILGSYIATSHLINKGCDRIAMVGGLRGQLVSMTRCQGYKRALQEAGIAYDDKLLIEPEEMDEHGGYLALLELLRRNIEFNGIFCASDLRSIGVIRALKEKGLIVPDDVSVVGYDDLTVASFFDPPLTTVRQPTYAVGLHAMNMMQSLINNEKPAENRKIFNPELVIRESG